MLLLRVIKFKVATEFYGGSDSWWWGYVGLTDMVGLRGAH